MLKLRLSRGGTKKRPVYKVVVADSRFARDGRFIEKVGFFNPLLPKEKKERIGLEAERIKYWLSQGAQPTTRVARILGENELMPMPANGNNPQKAIPKKDRKKESSEETKKEETPKADASALGVSSFLVSSELSFFLSFFGIAFCGLFPLAGIGINSFSPKILATLVVGCAPWLNQYLILSASNPILSFFSFGNNGLKNPTFSINLPSLAKRLSATTTL